MVLGHVLTSSTELTLRCFLLWLNKSLPFKWVSFSLMEDLLKEFLNTSFYLLLSITSFDLSNIIPISDNHESLNSTQRAHSYLFLTFENKTRKIKAVEKFNLPTLIFVILKRCNLVRNYCI